MLINISVSVNLSKLSCSVLTGHLACGEWTRRDIIALALVRLDRTIPWGPLVCPGLCLKARFVTFGDASSTVE